MGGKSRREILEELHQRGQYDLRGVAIHEAGHALVALLLRRRFVHVTVEARHFGNVLTLGHVARPVASYAAFRLKKGVITSASEADKRRCYEREVMVYLGGHAAETVIYGEADEAGSSSDMGNALLFASEVVGESSDECRAYVNGLHERTVSLLNTEPLRDALTSLASWLMLKNQLGHREARDVVNLALGAHGLRLSPRVGGVAEAWREHNREETRRYCEKSRRFCKRLFSDGNKPLKRKGKA